MWTCNTHMKEVLTLLETPHISKAPYRIKCSFCDNRALTKVYYAHQPLQIKKIKNCGHSPWPNNAEVLSYISSHSSAKWGW